MVTNPGQHNLELRGSQLPTAEQHIKDYHPHLKFPKSKADFAFVLHALSYLSSRGRAAIVCFPGIFYRGGAEQKIRKYLVDNNYVETVISLAPNLFFGTTIAVTGDDVFQGTCIQFADGGTTAAFYEAAGTNRITFDGSTKGGIIGDSIELIDMRADTWFVRILQSATGAEASPFSTV